MRKGWKRRLPRCLPALTFLGLIHQMPTFLHAPFYRSNFSPFTSGQENIRDECSNFSTGETHNGICWLGNFHAFPSKNREFWSTWAQHGIRHPTQQADNTLTRVPRLCAHLSSGRSQGEVQEWDGEKDLCEQRTWLSSWRRRGSDKDHVWSFLAPPAPSYPELVLG